MRISSAPHIVTELEMIVRRPPPADATTAVFYTQEDLPSFHSRGDHLQSTRHLGERLIAQAAHTHGYSLVSVGTRPTHWVGLDSLCQTSPPPDTESLTLPPAGPTAAQAAFVMETVCDTLDGLTEEQMSGARPGSPRDLRPHVKAVKAVLADQLELAQEFAAGTDAASMIDHIVLELGANPQPPAERAQSLLDFFSRVLSNQFDEHGGRWGANITNVVLRDLATVGLTTVLRQLAGMALESRFIQEDLPPETRQWIGASMMLLGPCLNILGGLREEMNDTATDKSRFARGTMLVLSLSVLAAAVVINRSEPAAQMASFGLQIAIYTTVRDLMQLFIPLQDNTTSLSASSTAMAGLGYGVTQVMASLLMDTLAPHSGAGYPMSVAANTENAAESLMEMLLAQSVANTAPTASAADVRAKVVSAIEDLQPQLGHDLLRGLINTVAEMADDLLRPAIARHREVQSLIARTRAAAEAAGQNADEALRNIPPEDLQGLRIYFATPRLPIVGSGFPTREQFLDQMLTTNAMRTSIFQAVTGAILTAGTVLGNLGLSATQQNWAGYAVLAGVMQIGYTPFLLAHDRSRDGNAERSETPNPQAPVRTPTTPSDVTYF
ncbi:hypothetical protein ACYZTX_00270 [Pseudomonas sp. MDT1-17]